MSMLQFDIEEHIQRQWQRTIDMHFALNLGGLTLEFKSMLIRIRELEDPKLVEPVYRCEAHLDPVRSDSLVVHAERADCGSAISECMARVRRTLQRSARVQAQRAV